MHDTPKQQLVTGLSDAELYAELRRRFTARHKGLCDYCGAAPGGQPCDNPLRHYACDGVTYNPSPKFGKNIVELYRAWMVKQLDRYPKIVARTGDIDRADGILQAEFRRLLISCREWEVFAPLTPTTSTYFTDAELLEMGEANA